MEGGRHHKELESRFDLRYLEQIIDGMASDTPKVEQCKLIIEKVFVIIIILAVLFPTGPSVRINIATFWYIKGVASIISVYKEHIAKVQK